MEPKEWIKNIGLHLDRLTARFPQEMINQAYKLFIFRVYEGCHDDCLQCSERIEGEVFQENPLAFFCKSCIEERDALNTALRESRGIIEEEIENLTILGRKTLAENANDGKADQGVDSGSNPSQAIVVPVSVELATKKRHELWEIEEAIQMYELGIYGICFRCYNLIPRGRLRVAPAAKSCVICIRPIL